MKPIGYGLEQFAGAYLLAIGGALWIAAFILRAQVRAAERAAMAVSPR